MAKIGLYLDRGDISVSDFTEAFSAQVRLVREVMIEMGIPAHEVRWVVDDLNFGSAAAVAAPQVLGGKVFMSDIDLAIRAAGVGMRELESSPARPKFFNDEALKTSRRLIELASGSDAGKARLTFGEQSVAPSAHITANVDTIIKSNLQSIGSIEGLLIGVQSKDGAYRIAIKDRFRGRSVPCSISPELLKRALDAFERRVIVRGIVVSRSDGSAVRIDVRSFEVVPEDDELVAPGEVRGILAEYRRADGD